MIFLHLVGWFILLLALLFMPLVNAIEGDEWLSFSGYQSFPSVNMKNHKWQKAIDFWQTKQPVFIACEQGANKCVNIELMDIISMLKIINKAQGLEKVKRLNRYVNMQLGHTIDKVWYNALSFLQAEPSTGSFTALKYFLLKKLGFTDAQMRVVVVKIV
ncbi:MAG: putative transglutaminase-like cysteine proteinase [Alphaproteobacteria bacterium]|jgi:predicted transglutaminase-like cysteine proteinase